MKKLYTILFSLLLSSLTLFAQTETEPNDNINQGSNSGNTFTASTTTTLSIGATITVANNDFYKINLPSCGSWAFNIINDSGQGVVNVKFYNAQNITTGLILDSNYNFNDGLPTPLVINCGQTIWVQVDQTFGTDIGAYKLEVSQYTTGDTYECNNDFATATPLSNINSSFSAKLWGYDCSGNPDADYFTYTPTKCGVLKVVVTNQNAASELTIDVFDDATPAKKYITTLALNGDFGALLEANKKYYFRITDATSFGDFYDLFDDPFTITTSYDTSDIYECNNTFSTSATLPIGQSFDIKLWGQNSQINLEDNRPQDADYFTYTPTQCGVLKVVVTNQNVGAELTVSLYDDATPIKNLISTLPLNGNLGALLEANKKYYFVITDATSFGDNYDLFDDAFTVTTAFYTSPVVTQVGTTYSTIQTTSSQSNTYQWYRNGVLISGANSSSYTSSLAGPYTVCISNAASCSTCSANLSNESFEQTVLSVYPNPTSSVLKLQFDNNTTIDKVIITDITGKKVLEQTENNAQINVESLANGTYIIEVLSENKKFQSKFIKE